MYSNQQSDITTGWLCFTGWHAAIGAMAFLIGTMMQALIVLHQPDTYVYKTWHGTLLIIALILGAFVFNTLLAKRLPLVEGLVLLVHVCGLFAIIIPLWALSPRKPAEAVFAEFTNKGGWPSVGLSFLAGLLPLSASLGGIDCVAHMGEWTGYAATRLLFARPANGYRNMQPKRLKILLEPYQNRL
jgi:amino acid transporter